MILGHVIGEFYLIDLKKQAIKWKLLYEFLYGCTFMIISIPVINVDVVILNSCIWALHLVTNSVSWFIERKIKINLFFIKQIVFVAGIIIASYISVKLGLQLQCILVVQDFFEIVNISEIMVCKWTLGLLIIHKPANQLIQVLIPNYKPKNIENVTDKEENKKIGRVIGTVERAIMLLLIYMNQYAAIGLVLTAKSIARYDKIAKEKNFAEYYLLGTLLSLGIVVVCGVLLFGA